MKHEITLTVTTHTYTDQFYLADLLRDALTKFTNQIRRSDPPEGNRIVPIRGRSLAHIAWETKHTNEVCSEGYGKEVGL